MRCMSKPPNNCTSVFTTPSRFRFALATVAIERISSYSIGVPRSKNGTTTFCSPQVIGRAHENLIVFHRPAAVAADRMRADAELLLGAGGFFGGRLGADDSDLNPAAAQLLEFAQIVEQVQPRLHVVFRHGRADVGVDMNRPVLRVQAAQQADRIGRERTDPFGRHVVAEIERLDDHDPTTPPPPPGKRNRTR